MLATSGSLLVNRTAPSGKAGQVAAGTGPLKVNVPPDVPPPATGVGEMVIDESVGKFAGRTNRERCQPLPPLAARMSTSTSTAGGEVAIGKVALDAPAGMVTLAGTLANAG